MVARFYSIRSLGNGKTQLPQFRRAGTGSAKEENRSLQIVPHRCKSLDIMIRAERRTVLVALSGRRQLVGNRLIWSFSVGTIVHYCPDTVFGNDREVGLGDLPRSEYCVSQLLNLHALSSFGQPIMPSASGPDLARI